METTKVILEKDQKTPQTSNAASKEVSKEIPEDLFEEELTPICELNKEASKLSFTPLPINENRPKNYSTYIATNLKEISKLSGLNFQKAIEDPDLAKTISIDFTQFKKKIVLLDMDETLIHADFMESFDPNEYDQIVHFEVDEQDFQVGIFIRNGVQQFLQEISQKFSIGIFTAACKEYADAVLDILDPERKFIEFSLYRNSCLNVSGSNIKDLRILKGLSLKDVVLVDNNICSFSNQLDNGILVSSFYTQRDDADLYQVMHYLLNYIYDSDDVRVVNSQFFKFTEIMESFTPQKIQCCCEC